eukprot:1159766-Pelagomonas_calceolata.AAC.11
MSLQRANHVHPTCFPQYEGLDAWKHFVCVLPSIDCTKQPCPPAPAGCAPGQSLQWKPSPGPARSHAWR